MTDVIDQAHGDAWSLYNGDSAIVLPGVPDHSIGFAIFSPPFGDLYVYSASERDLGNCRSDGEFWEHFGYISRELLRVMQPGRNVCVHVAQIPLQKAKDGLIALRDFRGETIRHFVGQGFAYHGEATIDKNPQVQAIRTHAKGLAFPQLKKDSAWMRPALADYVLVFRAPGENATPIIPDVDNDTWIQWAYPVWKIASADKDAALLEGTDVLDLAPGTPLIWYGIDATETLNVTKTKEPDDNRHICPLQLGTIERCIRLWSNPGETVLSPFAGIGSEGFVAVQHRRRFIGIELKSTWFRIAARNLERAEPEARPLLAALDGLVAG